MFTLKNRRLHEALDEFSDGDFSLAMKRAERDSEGKWFLVTFNLSEGILVQTYIRDYELQEVPRFKPMEWNSFPEIQPPIGAPMMVETYEGERVLWCGCALFNSRTWKTFDGKPIALEEGQKLRFKAWGVEQ